MNRGKLFRNDGLVLKNIYIDLWLTYRIKITIPICYGYTNCYSLCQLTLFCFKMPSTRSTDEFNAAVAEKVEEFKLAFIEQMKSNLREVFKDEIRQIIKEELKEIEKLSSTVSLFQKHVNTLRESNVALQEKCNNLEHLVECNEQ